jgi:hypothetical protein
VQKERWKREERREGMLNRGKRGSWREGKSAEREMFGGVRDDRGGMPVNIGTGALQGEEGRYRGRGRKGRIQMKSGEKEVCTAGEGEERIMQRKGGERHAREKRRGGGRAAGWEREGEVRRGVLGKNEENGIQGKNGECRGEWREKNYWGKS